MLSPVRLSSVCNVRDPTQPAEISGNFSTPFGTLAIHWHPPKFLRRSSPVGGGVNARGERNIAISDISNAVSPKWCKIGGKLVLITNRKSYFMSFRLVPKSATLNDLDRRNDPYFALFHRTLQLPGRIAQKWLKIYLNFLRQKCIPKHLVFSDISLTMIPYIQFIES